jgi:hypothetical protein
VCSSDLDGGVPTTQGALTITGLGAYDGNFAYAMGVTENNETILCWNATGAAGSEAVPIEGGQVALPVYTVEGGILGSYSGNETFSLSIAILSTPVLPGTEGADNLVAVGTVPDVLFTNGIGTVENPSLDPVGNGGVPMTLGALIITGLGAYNDNFAYAAGRIETEGEIILGIACGRVTGAQQAEAVLISDGQVVLPVYKTGTAQFEPYSGTDTFSLNIAILSTKVLPVEEEPTNMVAIGTPFNVPFTNGIGVVHNPLLSASPGNGN